MSLAEQTLDPALAIEATLLVDRTPLRWTEPPVGLFLAPELVGILEHVGPLVDAVVRETGVTAAARGEVFPRDKVTSLLESALEEWLGARPDTARWVDMSRTPDGRLRLAARPEGLDRFVSPDRVAIRLRFAMGHQHAEHEIPLSSARALTVVMDLLRGDFPPGVDLALADRSVRAVIASLEGLGALVPKAEAGEAFVPDGHVATRLTITHMGHAFLIVDGASRRVLFDPVVVATRPDFTTLPLTPRQLGEVDAIFFTQHGRDHLDLSSLLRLPHRVPVFVPGGAEQPLTPRCADYLRTLGFADVREIAPGDVARVGDLQVHALPFCGKGHDVLSAAANTYIVSFGEQRALVHADASRDTNGRSIVSTGELARRVAAGGPIRTIYASWWARRDLACLLSPSVLFRPEVTSDRWLSDVAYHDSSDEFLVSLVRTCRARRVLLYGDGRERSFLPPEQGADADRLKAYFGKPRAEVLEQINRLTGMEAYDARPYQSVDLSQD